MNPCAAYSTPANARGTHIGIALLLLLAVPAMASAEDRFSPYAKITYDHDSNIFAYPSAGPDLPPGTPTAQGDSRETYVGGADISEQFGRQKLRATLEGRRINYDRLSDLSHDESLASAALEYEIGSAIDGNVRTRQEKRMAPFTERVSNTLSIETERTSFASMRFRITPEWSLQPDVARRDLASPQPLYPDLRLREDTFGAALTYAGRGPLRLGLQADRLSGVYTGVAGVPDISQTTVQLTADYQVTGVSSFKGAIGHTRREQGTAANNISDVTGVVGYRRQLTGKTAISLELSRAVNSYITAGSSEVDTRQYFSVEWQATRKVGVTASYTQTHAVFVGEIITGEGTAGRKDDFGTTRLSVDYRALRWLSIRPYFQYQHRDSNDPTLTFRGTLVGVEVMARRFGDRQ
jgi:hypothetical protein